MDSRGRSELRCEIAMLMAELAQRDQTIQNQFTEMHEHMNAYPNSLMRRKNYTKG